MNLLEGISDNVSMYILYVYIYIYMYMYMYMYAYILCILQNDV